MLEKKNIQEKNFQLCTQYLLKGKKNVVKT